ncbi:MerR family transcriptional regulator [Gallionella capsiferriformans]|uniref:Mercuric resistance operon regulatory protein n=2 Tax=Gallionella TaxID=96 RepID=D9SHA7_GALCS|nr:transcriptional regulator, MerR family [Gallionella capsiferriformans ES-2]
MKTSKASFEQAKRSGQTNKASAPKLQIHDPENGMTIGQLASEAGVNVETIRYYQREKLLNTPKREFGSIRRYGAVELNCLLFIKRAQAIGFSLTEISLLLKLAEGEHCAETKRLAEKKLVVIKQKIADLLSIESSLEKLISACRKGKGGCGCPIIDSLVGGERTLS